MRLAAACVPMQRASTPRTSHVRQHRTYILSERFGSCGKPQASRSRPAPSATCPLPNRALASYQTTSSASVSRLRSPYSRFGRTRRRCNGIPKAINRTPTKPNNTAPRKSGVITNLCEINDHQRASTYRGYNPTLSPSPGTLISILGSGPPSGMDSPLLFTRLRGWSLIRHSVGAGSVGFDRTNLIGQTTGHDRIPRCDAGGLLEAAGDDEPVATDHLFGLGEGALGDSSSGDQLPFGREPLAWFEFPLGLEPLVPGVEVVDGRLDLLWGLVTVPLATGEEKELFLGLSRHGFLPKQCPTTYSCTLSGGSDSSCEEIAATAWVFDLWVGLPLDVLDNSEPCVPQSPDHGAWDMKAEVQGDRRAEELIEVSHLVSDVERDQRQASRHQSSAGLLENRVELVRREVHDGVERHDPRETRIGEVEPRHVSDANLEIRVKAFGDSDHSWREVDADDGDTLLVEIASDMAGTASEVGNGTAAACLLREPVEEVPVERLAVELRRPVLGAGLRRRGVAVARGRGR